MSHTSLAQTVFPAGVEITQDNKDLLNRFFHLVDLNDPGAGKTLAEDIFTDDGIFIAPGGSFQGREAIIGSRANAWKVIQFRQHDIDALYVGNPAGTDLVLTGTMTMRTKDGQTLNKFAAHIEIADVAGKARIKSYQAFTGSVA